MSHASQWGVQAVMKNTLVFVLCLPVACVFPSDSVVDDGAAEFTNGSAAIAAATSGGYNDGGDDNGAASFWGGTIELDVGHFAGTTTGGNDLHGGGDSCVPGGAPDQIFHVVVPSHLRVMVSARADFVATLYQVKRTGDVNCARPAGPDGLRTELAWYNESSTAADFYFLLDWAGGWPNPTAIPASGEYTLDVSFDPGPQVGESCLHPQSLSLSQVTHVTPSAGHNDEGPGSLADQVFIATVPASTRLDLAFTSQAATANVYAYVDPSKCGTKDSVGPGIGVYNRGDTSHWLYENAAGHAITVTLLIESWGTTNYGQISISPQLSTLE